MDDVLAILPATIAAEIAGSGGAHGTIDLRHDPAENLLVVSGYSKGNTRRHNRAGWLRDHYLNWASIKQDSGLWYRVEPELHLAGYASAIRDGAIPIEAFWDHVPSGRRVLSPGGSTFALTFTAHPEGGEPIWSGWWISREMAAWCSVAVLDEDADVLDPVAEVWPLGVLTGARVVVVGAGSIGSAACDSLAAYGLRDLVIVDPDRLLPHNIARHRLDRSQVGRHKAYAVAKRLRDRDGVMQVEPLALDVIDDADILRPVVKQATAVLVTSDGVESRRVANHLAARAGIPAVFACVLDNGRYGEIIRVVPGRTGCLLCARAKLAAEGGIDPEPSLDRGYGTGTRHLPMAAVGGDLGIVGDFAAKAVVCTILERAGFRDQRLHGDHAIIALRAAPRLAAPFNIELTGDIHWQPGASSRPTCPSCGTR